MTINSLLNWKSENEFSISGVNFLSTNDPKIYHHYESTDSGFLLVKSRSMLECALDTVRELSVRNMVDIGIWQGGSVAFFDLMLTPSKLVALEFSDRDIPALDNYIYFSGRTSNVRLHKGVNQADSFRLQQIVRAEFNGDPIDLVIDDASHFYEETCASFDVLFPSLREGGKFIIEDWQWSTNAEVAKSDYFDGKPGLSNLVLQCMLLCATHPDIIESVTIHPHMAIVTRGAATDLKAFSIMNMARNRGTPIPLFL
jgi:hypothetical protein